MAAPLLQNFATLVSNQIAAVQTAAAALVNFTTGSILRSIINANSSIGLWLQGLALQVMALTRFASSYGSDADSWGKDWGFYRISATPSLGAVTFSRFTATAAAFVPVGAIVQTADRTQQFAVIADATNSAWDGSTGFTIPGGTASLALKVRSVNAAQAANVGIGTVSMLVTSIAGVDFVSNAAAFTGGTDPEPDPVYKARFPDYLQSIAKGTLGAIRSAISAIQTGLEIQILENVTYAGATQGGYLTVIVDDGTGSPPGSLLTAAATAVDNSRAAGIQFGVFGPSITTISISYAIVTATGYDHTALVTASQNAVLAYVDALLDGATLYWSAIWGVVYNSSPGITDVTGLLINSGTADIVPATSHNVIKVGSVTGA